MSKIVIPYPEKWSVEPAIEASGGDLRLYRFDTAAIEGLYKFNGDAADGSGKGRGGTAYDVSYEAGKAGLCAVFNGSSGYASLPYDFGAATAVSVSFWINMASLPGTDKGILSSAPNLGAPRLYIGIQGTTGKLFCYRGAYVYSALPLTAGDWRHVVVISDGTTTSFYIDNVHAGSNAQSVAVSAQSSLYVGRGYHGYLNGKLDALCLFGRALTKREREYLYNCGLGVETIPYSSGVAESPWIALKENALSDSPVDIRENIRAAIDGYTAGAIGYQYALNGGAYNGSYLTLAALNAALKGQAIADHTNSLRIKAQFVSDGSQAADISGLGVDIGHIEERIIEALRRLSFFKTVESRAAECDIESLPVRFPAAFVSFGGSQTEDDAETADFIVRAAVKDLKGGGGGSELIKSVADTLSGNDLGLDIGGLMPMKVSSADRKGPAALTLKTRFERRPRYD